MEPKDQLQIVYTCLGNLEKIIPQEEAKSRGCYTEAYYDSQKRLMKTRSFMKGALDCEIERIYSENFQNRIIAIVTRKVGQKEMISISEHSANGESIDDYVIVAGEGYKGRVANQP